MGKHDKVVAASSDEFRDNSIRDLRERLVFAEETIKKLQEQCSRMSKWASEIEANAQDAIAKKDEYIALLEKALAKEAVKAVKHGI